MNWAKQKARFVELRLYNIHYSDEIKDIHAFYIRKHEGNVIKRPWRTSLSLQFGVKPLLRLT